jgi:type III secretion system low calcium response chaperone LcrH/SycD
MVKLEDNTHVFDKTIDINLQKVIDLFMQKMKLDVDKEELISLMKTLRDDYVDRTSAGFQEIIFHLKKPYPWKTVIDNKQIVNELGNAVGVAESINNGTFKLGKAEEEKTLKELFQFSPELMARVYEIAFLLYQEKNLTGAINVFSFLCTVNPFVYEYWYGLGVAYQADRSFDQGIWAYSMAAVCNLNPLPHLRSAECYMLLNDKTQALGALDIATELAVEKEFDAVKAEVLRLKKIIN